MFFQKPWPERMIGTGNVYCLILIMTIGLGLLSILLLALRHGAPSNPGITGAVAGLLAGGISATIPRISSRPGKRSPSRMADGGAESLFGSGGVCGLNRGRRIERAGSQGKLNGISPGDRLPSRSAPRRKGSLTDFCSMIRLLLGVITSALAAFGVIYGLLWLACYIADHDWLVMLHMHFSAVILSLAFGIILSLNFDKLNALRGRLRRKAPFSGGLGGYP
ncbi:MAG: NrsF family protein [Ensifer adhaerens]